MAFERCNNCGGSIQYHEALKGQKAKCPQCQQWQAVGIPPAAHLISWVIVLAVIPLVIGIYFALATMGGQEQTTHPSAADSLAAFEQAAEENGTAALFIRLDVSGNTLTAAVRNLWHSQPKQMRLQAAQNIWAEWANIYSPDNPDLARLKLTDANGNEIGGSRTLGGSLLWVAK